MNRMKSKWWEYGDGYTMDGGGTMSTYKYNSVTRSLENRIQRALFNLINFNMIKWSIL